MTIRSDHPILKASCAVSLLCVFGATSSAFAQPWISPGNDTSQQVIPKDPLPPVPDNWDPDPNPGEDYNGHVDIPEIDREPPKDDVEGAAPAGGFFGEPDPIDLLDFPLDGPVLVIDPASRYSPRNVMPVVLDAIRLDAPLVIAPTANSVPAPGSLVLIGLSALGLIRRKR